MFKDLKRVLRTNKLFEDSDNQYWDDVYISKNLLSLHLEEYGDNASRNFNFLDDSVAFIDATMKKYNLDSIVDFGCGPGLYCAKLAQKSYDVSGIDFSKRSIDYAQSIAENNNLDIEYLYQDYLNYSFEKKHDFATLIYCDYGSLSKKNRLKLLNNINHSLNPSGYFMLDVFSVNKFMEFKEQKTFKEIENKSFWYDKPHLEFTIDESFKNFIALNKTVIVAENESKVINRWYQYFTLEMLEEELNSQGFEIIEVYDDVLGNDYTNQKDTLAVLARKL